MTRRGITAVISAVVVALVSFATPAVAVADRSGPPPTIAVLFPGGLSTSWTVAGLEGLPRTTVTAADGRPVTGVSLPGLVAASGTPPTDAGKNPQLRTSYEVAGEQGYVRFAGGELDPGFGNHPALITEQVTAAGAPRFDLVVPEDPTTSRTVLGVSAVRVSQVAVSVVAAPTPGGIFVTDGTHTLAATREQLAQLPLHDASVSFLTGTGPQTHDERGVLLTDLLAAAGAKQGPTTLVTAVGSDGYAASVTPGEAFGDRRIGLALVEDGQVLDQPRLVVLGDVKGGRYVSQVTELLVQQGDGQG